MKIEKLKTLEPIFGQWYIDGKIAQGRNSEVFRVTRKAEQKDEYLAIKVIRIPKNERNLNRIMQTGRYKDTDEYLDVLEAKLKVNMEKMMAMRNNKNIIRFDKYMIARDDNCLHVIILMELLSALGDYLSPERLVPKEIAKMGVDICCALEQFRQAGIMHREVKPENIFVDSTGSYKLGDFGVDEVEETGGGVSEISNYLAPEVLNASGVDYSSDIYSLGIMLYKFTNHNRMPFSPEFPSPISLADRQRAFERRMSGERLSKPSQADMQLSKIIFKATMYKPEQRYSTPEQLEDDLRRYLLGMEFPVGGVPRSASEQHAESDRTQKEFADAFADDEDVSKTGNTKLYVLAAVLGVVLIALTVLAFSLLHSKNEKPTVPFVSETTTESTTEPTTETQTTQQETQTPPTTEEPTTAETTTQELTTTEPPTQAPTQPSEPYVPIIYKETDKKAGDVDARGRIYTNINNAEASKEIIDDVIVKAEIKADAFGSSAQKEGEVYICQISDGIVVLRESVDFECVYDDNDPSSGLIININIDREIFYEPDTDYYIVFEEGALVSDNKINLPIQIKI